MIEDDLRREWLETVPRDFHEADLGALEPNVRRLLDGWIPLVTDRPDDLRVRGSNLVITGPVGCGKTYAAFAVLRKMYFEGTPSRQYWAPNGVLRRSFRYWSAPDVLARLRHDDQVRDQLIDARVLFLDDLGTTRSTDWALEQFFCVLNARYADLRPVITTSNLSLEDLERYLGAPSYSRLVDGAVLIHMSGRNRRQRPPLELIKGETNGGEQ
jgi:DNA replication protein DnaC